MKRLRFILILFVLGVLGVLVSVFRPAAEEVGDNEPPSVSEADVELYINVYRAMQENHDLTIDSAIQPYHLTLDDFRQLERRIQSQPRLVERVRQALLETAKTHSAFAQALASPTPAATPAGPSKQHRRKKR